MLIDMLPKNDEDKIILNPANNRNEKGFVEVDWFKNNFQELAESETPLSDEKFNQLKSIDKFWKKNAEKWREEGLI